MPFRPPAEGSSLLGRTRSILDMTLIQGISRFTIADIADRTPLSKCSVKAREKTIGIGARTGCATNAVGRGQYGVVEARTPPSEVRCACEAGVYLKNLYLSSMNCDSSRYAADTRMPNRLKCFTNVGRKGWCVYSSIWPGPWCSWQLAADTSGGVPGQSMIK